MGVFHILLLLGTALFAQNTYLGPTHPPSPQTSHFVRVQILIRDSPEQGGVQILSATFNRQSIPLKPRDIYGNRGGAGFQVLPGNYTLQWVVNRDHFVWPRRTTHEEEVQINPRDLWVQILIEGEEASIR